MSWASELPASISSDDAPYPHFRPAFCDGNSNRWRLRPNGNEYYAVQQQLVGPRANEYHLLVYFILPVALFALQADERRRAVTPDSPAS